MIAVSGASAPAEARVAYASVLSLAVVNRKRPAATAASASHVSLLLRRLTQVSIRVSAMQCLCVGREEAAVPAVVRRAAAAAAGVDAARRSAGCARERWR